MFKNNFGNLSIYLILSALGLIIFLIITSSLDFKSKLFSSLYNKKISSASGPSPTPVPFSAYISMPPNNYSTAKTSPVTVQYDWSGNETSYYTVVKAETFVDSNLYKTQVPTPGNNQIVPVYAMINIKANSLRAGTHTIYTKLTTDTGLTATTAPVNINVTSTDTNPPIMVTLEAYEESPIGTSPSPYPSKTPRCPVPGTPACPRNGSNNSQFKVTVRKGTLVHTQARYRDDTGVNKLQVYKDGVKVGSNIAVPIDTTPLYPLQGLKEDAIDTSKLNVGTYKYTFKAFDRFNNSTVSNELILEVTSQ